MLNGEVKVVAAADLGGLGAKEGPGTLYTVRLPNVLPSVLPWLLVLGLFLLKANRRAPAGWVLVPLGLVAGGCGLAATLEDLYAGSSLDQLFEVVTGLAFGLAVTWLLSPYLRRSHRLLTFLLTLLTLTGASLAALLLRQGWDWEGDTHLQLALVVFGCTLALSLALCLTGFMCRRRFNGLRCSLWLFGEVAAFWLLIVTTFAAFALAKHDSGLELWQFGLIVLLTVGVSFGSLLPFLGLSLVNGFYKERLKRFLHAEPVAPPVMAAPTAGASV